MALILDTDNYARFLRNDPHFLDAYRSKMYSEKYRQWCVLVVDLQRYFERTDNWPKERVYALKSLIEDARDRAIPVIYLKYLLDKGSKHEEYIIEEVKPLAEEIIIEKSDDNGFFETCLDETLEKKGAMKLVMVGGNAHACVMETFFGARSSGYEVIIIEDALLDVDEKTRLDSIEKFRYSRCIVTDTKRVFA